MLTRLILILALFLQPTSFIGASSCGTLAPELVDAAHHECCCGTACPAGSEIAAFCGCAADDDSQSQPKAPPSPDVRMDFALTQMAVIHLSAAAILNRLRIDGRTQVAASSVSRHALYCVWRT